MVWLQIKLLMSVRPLVNRFCSLTFRLSKYDSPPKFPCITTPLLVPLPAGYWGNGTSSCDSATVEPFKEVLLGSSPLKGFGTEPERRLMVALSRTGEVLRYCRGMVSS